MGEPVAGFLPMKTNYLRSQIKPNRETHHMETRAKPSPMELFPMAKGPANPVTGNPSSLKASEARYGNPVTGNPEIKKG
jgi:hypothetical protein